MKTKLLATLMISAATFQALGGNPSPTLYLDPTFKPSITSHQAG